MSASPTRSQQIFAGQVRTLYAQLPVSVPTQLVGATLFIAALCTIQLFRLAL